MTEYSKPDHWSIKAQKEGYPARSVYKLKEMDEKFGLVKSARSPFRVLDLGAAPGSWSLYILRKLPLKEGALILSGAIPAEPLLVSIDLAPLSRQYDEGLFDRPDFLFIQGDFTSGEIRETIVSHGPYNLVVSDAAPFTTGNRSVDTLRSLDLAETALHYAEIDLARGGNLAIKVFQGGDTGKLLKAIRGLFETGKSFKPQACRAGSFETYYLGLGRR
ncbi:MAG: RlmE family RNA methyltransferase [Treponema sp.]|jgi:23S rRNA (uridine2552-2'-O)-methyltransferase|nr:RlmE family RNA methyltransferase [Treponema sp.]